MKKESGMAKVTIRDAILANVFAAILFAVFAVVWTASAVVKTSATTAFAPLPHSPSETLYNVGRYELLRDTAMICEKSFDQLVANYFHGQVEADWTMAVLALCAIGMLLFNVWFIRGMRRDMDALRSNPAFKRDAA
jgi:uncharacterized integral membrane protein